MRQTKWAYGITTVPERKDLLSQTIQSLKTAGFDSPRIFVDPVEDRLGAYGNWVLGLAELYLRNPQATKYVMFQDDVSVVEGLRGYLEGCILPAKHYWNLITYPQNATLALSGGWFLSDQRGHGAQGYVFSREALQALLGSQSVILKPIDVMRGKMGIDATVAVAMRHTGYKELCHNPSLLTHTGIKSTMGSNRQPEITSFTGRCTLSSDALKVHAG